MKITQQQFARELSKSDKAERIFHLILIGMSGIGKTHWAEELSQRYGHPHIQFDDLIDREFAASIEGYHNIPGESAVERLANYLKVPWSEGYSDREGVYSRTEKRFMSQLWSSGSVLDLTGSCINHLDEMRALRDTGLVIYLETSQEKQQEMFEIFMRDKKPICWGGMFERRNGETNEQALARCYRHLLDYRAGLYAQFADVALPYTAHKTMQSIEGFVQEVKKQLPRSA